MNNDNRGLWRGKTTPKSAGGAFNSIWVEGNLIQSQGSYYIHPLTNTVNVQNEVEVIGNIYDNSELLEVKT